MIRRGDIVRYRPGSGRYLRSGAQQYDSAVCVREGQPPVLVSLEGDMRWEGTVQPEMLEKIGEADPKLLAFCDRRLES